MAGLSGMFVASLTLLCLKVLSFFSTQFLFATNLWYPIYFSPRNGGHSYTFSKLSNAAVGLHQHYPYNGFNYTDFSRKKNKDVKGAFSKITTQVQTKPFNNLLQNTINKLKLHPRTRQAQNLLPLLAHTLNRLKINKKVLPPPHPTHF